MAKNISLQNIIGKKGIPTAYIKKIVLTPGTSYSDVSSNFEKNFSSLGLVAKIELSLADVRRGKRFQWVTDERLRKYLRIRVIESRNPKLTKMLADGGVTTEKLKQAKRNYDYREKFISLSNDIDVEQVEKYRQNKGRTIYMIPYETEFFIPNLNPSHLAYFCSCTMDTVALTRDFGAKLKNKRFREVQGFVSGDLVIFGGQPVSNASTYQLPNGMIYPGPVHFHRTENGGRYMAGPKHTAEPHPVLERKQIPNFKTQDQRVFDTLDNLRFGLDIDDDVFEKINKRASSKKATGTKFSKKPNFISNAYFSRDSDGKSNIVFSVDTRRILMERGKFGKILNSQNAEVAASVESLSRISSFKLLRRRVQKNNLSENPRTKYKLYDNNSKRELIARNAEKLPGEFKRRVYKVDKDGELGREVRIGMVKEISLLNTSNLRTFSCTDFSMSNVTDGIYQYGVEIQMEDGTLQFVIDKQKALKESKAALLNYYNESRKPENYDSLTNRFTQQFENLNRTRYPDLPPDLVNNTPNLERQAENPTNSSDSPWNIAISVMMDAIISLANTSNIDIAFIASNLHSLVNPKTGTPDGIEKFITAYERVEGEIGRLLARTGHTPAEMDVSVKSSIHKERFKKSKIIVKKRFKQVFDSDVEKGIEYDFLGGRKNNRGGLREITLDFYQNRIDKEGEKYFSGELRRSNVPILDLRASKFAYLSPAVVKYGVKRLKILGSGKSLWNRKRYNDATAVIASMNMDTSREVLSSPVGTARRLEGQRGMKESISRNILASHGITIERPKPRRMRKKAKEDVPTEDILGEDVLAAASQQALDISEEDFEEEAEVQEEEVSYRKKLEPLNTMFVSKMLNEKQNDVFKIAERRGVSPGVAGFDLTKSDNILEVIYRGKPDVAEKIKNLPNQIKSLFLANRQIAVNRWHDSDSDPLLDPETYEMFRYNYFMLQRVEYLSGFETSEVDGRQITSPLFSLMDPAQITPQPGKSLLCRLRPYKNPSVYAGTPRHLRLPVRDKHFLITFGDRTVSENELTDEDETVSDEPIDTAASRIAQTAALSQSARRIMQVLLEKESRSESYYQYTSTIFINQPKDLIQEGAEIRTVEQPARTTTTTPVRQAPRTTAPAATAIARGTTTGGTGGGGY